MKDKKEVMLLGYSGHAFVICDILKSRNYDIEGYFENEEKLFNPYSLSFLGNEDSEFGQMRFASSCYFVAIGDNALRRKITEKLNRFSEKLINVIHLLASVSPTSKIGKGVLIGSGAVLNACCKIGNGVICNTNSIVEHECEIGDFSHIAPNATLCGNVKIGSLSFIGAGAVIKEGVSIGDKVTIGAGSVILKNVASNSVVVGNPQRRIKNNNL